MNFSTTEEAFVLSSLKEFVKVWGSGRQANFNLECRNGLACIKLNFYLGPPASPHSGYQQHQPPPFQPQPPRRRNGTARKQKNLERAKAHHAKLAAASAGPTSEALTDVADSESVIPAADPAELNNTPSRDEAQTSLSSNSSSPSVEPTAPTLPVPDTPLPTTAAASDADSPPPQATPSVAPAPASAPPANVPVYCLAVFENCPDEELTEEYGNSLQRYLASEQHLCQNIVSAQFNHESTRRFRNNLFVHTVAVILHMRNERLWESAASYIRKHLGLTNEWSKGNGTLIKLTRIHQK